MLKSRFLSRMVSVVITLCLVSVLLPMTAMAAPVTYYVDSVSGSDSNNGTSTSTPWKTLDKVWNTTYQPGDSILFKRGSTFIGTLSPSTSGNSSAQIIYGAYGTGAKPIINGNGGYEAVKIIDKSYITIQDLEIVNNAASAGDRRGIYIYSGAATVNGIRILNNDIHNVKGKYGANDYYQCAAILCDAYAADNNNLRIEGNNIHHNESQGIYTNGTGGTNGIRYNNLVVRNNTFNYNVKGDIIIGKAANPLIEYNIGTNAGQGYTGFYWMVSMWVWGCNGSTFQYNEVANVKASDVAGGGDSQAFDVDILCMGTHIFQYNYTRNNEGGTLLVMDENPGLAGTVYRYNIAQNDGHSNCNSWDNIGYDPLKGSTIAINNPGSSGTQIYNNVWFSNTADGIRIKDRAATYKNNIFYTTSEYKYPTTNPTYDYNCFYGGSPSTDTHKITSNPNFVNGGSGGSGRNSVDGYKLQSNSPCINSGVSISNNGGKDYWGTTLYVNAPDRGAHEFTGTPVSTPTPAPTATPTPTPAPGGGDVHSGSYAERAIFTTADAGKYYYQYPSVAASSSYTGKIWVKGSGKIDYVVQDASTYANLSTLSITATGTWTEYTLPTFNTGSRTSVAVFIKIGAGSSGTAYMDDLFLGISGGTNRLANPGFESATGWTDINVAPFSRISGSASTPTPTPTPTPAPGGGNVHSGSYAERAIFTTADAGKYYYQYPSVAASSSYTGKIWVKGSGKIDYVVQDASNYANLSTLSITATGTWTEYTLPTFNTGSRTSVAVFIKIGANSSGTVYMDDFFLGISGGTNRLANPGFESATGWSDLNVAPFSRVTG